MYEVASYTVTEVKAAIKRFAEFVSNDDPGAFGHVLAAMIADGEVEVVGIVDGQFAFRLVEPRV